MLKRWLTAIVMAAVASLSIGSQVANAEVTIQQTVAEEAVNQDLPEAKAEVAKASKKGSQSIEKLIESLTSATPAATLKNGAMTTTPKEYALGVALEHYIKTGGKSSPSNGIEKPPFVPLAQTSRFAHKKAKAAGAGCWYSGNHIYNYRYWGASWAPVAWVEVDHGVWCGNGYSITYNGLGFYLGKHWSTFPYCLETGFYQGWDAPYNSWAHAYAAGDLGIWTPWGSCGTFHYQKAALRIAGNGYWDRYDDI